MPSATDILSGAPFNDKRFDMRVFQKDGKTMVDNPVEGVAEVNPETAKPWVDIPLDTQTGDMRAIMSGKAGTSVGDSWPPAAVQFVKALQQQGHTPESAVPEFKHCLLPNRIPPFITTHPAKHPY